MNQLEAEYLDQKEKTETKQSRVIELQKYIEQVEKEVGNRQIHEMMNRENEK